MRTFTSLVVACLAVVTVTAAAPQEGATFKATTQLVSVPGTVLDGQARLVPNLDQDQFTIFDNGKPQDIIFFQNETQPFNVVVMLDFSASMTSNLDLLRDAAETFLMRMLPQDKGQVGAFSDRIEFSGHFTNDRDDLISALQDLQYGNPTRLWDAVDQSIDMLKPVDGRKIVLVFTDGDDTYSKIGFGSVLDHAKENEVMVYAIGLQSTYMGPNGRMVRSQPDRSLKKIAEETGGGYFELKKTDELAPTFTRVAQELHSLYTIGFAPATLDGKEHKLDVKMRQVGQMARARKTYVASAARLSTSN
jgi:Ca-activated chloride channel family protein